MLEATSTAPPTTPVVPLVAPATSEPFITISAIEFCAMPNLPGPSEPIPLAEETIPPEETTRAEVDVPIQRTQEPTIDASSPHDPTTT
uniref:Uncharacterized protein n=1 Tax=Vitis vinifera TaxID=29760 RepID=A5BPT1_VITVI|nr:hypothetical protein VITISV_022656 [Vitis vinifera]